MLDYKNMYIVLPDNEDPVRFGPAVTKNMNFSKACNWSLLFIFCHLDDLGIHMNENVLFTIDGFINLIIQNSCIPF